MDEEYLNVVKEKVKAYINEQKQIERENALAKVDNALKLILEEEMKKSPCYIDEECEIGYECERACGCRSNKVYKYINKYNEKVIEYNQRIARCYPNIPEYEFTWGIPINSSRGPSFTRDILHMELNEEKGRTGINPEEPLPSISNQSDLIIGFIDFLFIVFMVVFAINE